MLTQVRELLDEVAESLTTAIEASLPEEREEAEEPEDGLEADLSNSAPYGFRVVWSRRSEPSAAGGEE